METLGYSVLGRGRLTDGKWYCGCGQAARFVQTKKNGANFERKFWRCKNAEKQCDFFLWVDHEDGAREWITLSQPQPVPTTPKNAELIQEPVVNSPQPLQKPFIIAKRKELSRNALIEDEAGNTISHNANEADDPFRSETAAELHETIEHPRKAQKPSKISTPGRNFEDRLRSCTLSLPTPSTRDQQSPGNRLTSRHRISHQRDGSPTPVAFNDAADSTLLRESGLTATVLELVRADQPNIRDVTEMQIRHEIGMALDLRNTQLRRYEGTITELLQKVADLEDMLIRLT